MRDYATFLHDKAQLGGQHGFEPIWLPNALYPFQRVLVEWAIRKGRAALFEDCGLGKTLQELVFAMNVVIHTNRPVLFLAPLAVTHQVVAEAAKFGVEAVLCRDGKPKPGARIVVTNYERLHLFDPHDFDAVVADESSILKAFDGTRRGQVIEFMRTRRYRLLATATAAPNDVIELGNSSEALGELGHMDMLGRFFVNDQRSAGVGRHHGEAAKWRFKGHAEQAFWRWVCSWARAIRKPSDIGFDDAGFVLPPLVEREHIVATATTRRGHLFATPAEGLVEQREERRRTISERCERAAELATHDEPAVAWCHLNDEGDLLERLIPGAVQVSGRDSDDAKEEAFVAFQTGKVRALVTKPKIGAWGLNWQHCAHTTIFPSHSFEQFYQAVRRFQRFGQTRAVRVDVIASEGEAGVLENLQRKAAQSDQMFAALVEHMNAEMRVERSSLFNVKTKVPPWLSPISA